MTLAFRIRILALAGAALIFLAAGAHAPAQSEAAKSRTILDASRQVLGFDGGPVRERAFDDLSALGVDTLRILVWWGDMTPKPGALKPPQGLDQRDSRTYGPGGKRWRGVDAAVRMARERGITPYLVPSPGPTSGRIPRWAAQNPKRGAIDPKPVFFKRFMYALGRRYRGGFDPDGIGGQDPLPSVGIIGIGNEPNAARYLSPQVKNGKTYGPKLYRRLYIAARNGLRGSGWRGKVLIGETSPRGIVGNTEPLDFLRGVLCLDSKFRPKGRCAKLAADGWAHHPYALKSPPWLKRPDKNHISIGALERLERPLKRAARAGRISRKVKVWITEFGYQSYPDREFGLPYKRQYEYMAIAERIARERKGVVSFAQYLLYDDSHRSGFQSGLRLAKPRAAACGGLKVGCKPAWHAFRAPLAVRRYGKKRNKVSIWGHVRAATGRTTVRIRVRDRGRKPRLLAELRTNGAGYFVLRSSYRAGRQWGISASGKKGPLVRAYRY